MKIVSAAAASLPLLLFTQSISSIYAFHIHQNYNDALRSLVIPSSLSMVEESSTINDPLVISSDRYDELLTWTFGPSVASLDLPIQIQPSNCGHGNGLFVTRDVSRGNILFEIQSNKCVSLNSAWEHPNLGESLQVMSEEGDQEGRIAALAAYLASAVLREISAEWQEDDSLLSTFSPYLRTLPTGRGVGGHDHVLWWNDEEVEVFKGGISHDQVMAVREWVEDQDKIISSLLVSDLAARNEGVSVSQVSTVVYSAFVNVMTRSLEDDSIDGQKMIPILDMVQHSSEPNINWKTDLFTGCVVVQAAKDLEAGDELTIEYSNDLNKDEFFVAYGFVLPD